MHMWRSEEDIGYPGLVACLYILFGEMSVQVFGLFFFFKLSCLSLLLNCKSSLYILDNRHSCFKNSHLFNYSFTFFSEFVCVYICVPHVYLVLQKSHEVIGFPGTGVIGGYELPYG